jgi:endonuclease/exonuclease/phosphatase family metal-dependent hydrolase
MYQPAVNAIFFSFIMILATSSPAFAKEFYIAGWNVENLFDLEDDPQTEMDEDFTPNSPKRWTKERLEIKLKNLSEAICKMNGDKGPDVLGLCEVENRNVVEMLRERLAPLGRKYEIVHKDSPSDRGIDCALLYDANVFSLADSKFHFVDAEKTRDIVEAKLHRESGDLYVFVNHWPSRGNAEWQRLEAADVLRQRLDEILAADPKADIILVGDFNDELLNVSLMDRLQSSPSRKLLPQGALFDTTAALVAENKGTFLWENKWELIDHIIISQGLMDDDGYRWKQGSSQRIVRPELLYQPPYPNAVARPSASYTRDDFHANGYSDHLALGCVVVDKAEK